LVLAVDFARWDDSSNAHRPIDGNAIAITKAIAIVIVVLTPDSRLS